MKKVLLYLLSCVLASLCPCAIWAESFLTAQSFPKTFSDLPFTERMAVLKQGYEPFETQYDADGNCTSGCAFPGMKIEDAEKYYKRQAEIANARADFLRAQHPEWNVPVPTVATQPPAGAQVPTTTASVQTSGALPVPGTPAAATVNALAITGANNATAAQCPVTTPHNDTVPATQTVPTLYPMAGPVYINSAYGARTAPKTKDGRVGTACHRGVDLRAPVGTPLFATISGTVVTAGFVGDCGNSVKIKGPDGFSVGYCHLSKILVKKGDVVNGGCVIGLSGDTGNSGGPHLHYTIYDADNAQICPEKFIPTNQSGKPACGRSC